MKDVEWIQKVNEILSKREISVVATGDPKDARSDMDTVLGLISGNLTLLYTIPETKMKVYNYLRALENISQLAKLIYNEISEILSKRKIIKINNEKYWLVGDTILKEEEFKMIKESYINVMEAFRMLARRILNIILAGVDVRAYDESLRGYFTPQIMPQQTPQTPQYEEYNKQQYGGGAV